MNNSLRLLVLAILSVLILGTWGCSTTQKQTSRDRDGTIDSDTAQISNEERSALQTLLVQHRSKLSDLHATQTHDMPEAFTKIDSSQSSINSDPYDGYRIQIISTRNKQQADSVAFKYRAWSDTTIAGYTAEAYVFFRQPFYKVHVGDFQQRSQANSFSKLIKDRYPNAWVVHDRIEPSDVPADTTFLFHC
ncbi:MAG: SPOR domain-containing protein [Fodinibius sp.]|nr:SPOR domain-containing protein [Fodinibius sp.]